MIPDALLTRLSKTISYALHPLVIPTIAVILLLSGGTLLGGLPLRSKGFLVGIVLLTTLVIPALSIALLRTLRLIPDLQLNEPRYRILPLLIVAVGYVACSLMFSQLAIAFLIRRFLLAALGCILLALAVTPFWKISLHMIAMGGLLAVLSLINFSNFGHLPYTLLVFIVLAGLLGSARLWLGSHNLLQVAAGVFGGFLVAALTVLYV